MLVAVDIMHKPISNTLQVIPCKLKKYLCLPAKVNEKHPEACNILMFLIVNAQPDKYLPSILNYEKQYWEYHFGIDANIGTVNYVEISH